MARRRLTENQLVASVRRDSGNSAAEIARGLLDFAHANNLLVRRRHASVSIRIALGPGERPATLFVLPETNRFYTFWLDHWPKRYKSAVSQYESRLLRLFPKKAIIAPQGAKRNTVTLEDVAGRLKAVEGAVLQAINAIRSVNASDSADRPESLVGLEGELRRRMVRHRTREGRLRDARIGLVRNTTGALACEVRGCGFDFQKAYGELGENYAQVHHLLPLADREGPSKTRVSDLRVVCANCHAMIHLGGKSRTLGQISLALRGSRRRRAAV